MLGNSPHWEETNELVPTWIGCLMKGQASGSALALLSFFSLINQDKDWTGHKLIYQYWKKSFLLDNNEQNKIKSLSLIDRS